MLLSTEVWVLALVRRGSVAGSAVTVAHKGDVRAGAVLVRTFNRKTKLVRLFAEATRGDAERVWMQPLPKASEGELDAYAERALRIDPDLWIVEIEGDDETSLLTEPVEKT